MAAIASTLPPPPQPPQQQQMVTPPSLNSFSQISLAQPFSTPSSHHSYPPPTQALLYLYFLQFSFSAHRPSAGPSSSLPDSWHRTTSTCTSWLPRGTPYSQSGLQTPWASWWSQGWLPGWRRWLPKTGLSAGPRRQRGRGEHNCDCTRRRRRIRGIWTKRLWARLWYRNAGRGTPWLRPRRRIWPWLWVWRFWTWTWWFWTWWFWSWWWLQQRAEHHNGEYNNKQ